MNMLLKIKISAEALANEKFEPMFTIEEHSGGKVVINKFIINSEWSTKEDALVIAKKEAIHEVERGYPPGVKHPVFED